MPKFIVEMTEQQYNKLVARAEEEYGYDAEPHDFNPQDYSGGNFDDCYQMGLSHADADAAREILSILGEPVTE